MMALAEFAIIYSGYQGKEGPIMTWNSFQEPAGGQGPYIEYGAYGPATSPQMPPPFYGTPGAGPRPGINAPPLPLWEAIKQLPKQYWRVLTKPGPATFVEEMGKARWDIIWVQLFGLALISAILASLAWLILVALLTSFFNSLATGPDANATQVFSSFLLLPVPLFGLAIFVSTLGAFFFGQGITYLLAKAFGGQGDFTVQAYTALLYQVPITLVSVTLSLIPFVGSSIGSFAGIYGYVLQAFALMPVHRLSGGKAAAVVVIPIAVGFLLSFILVAIFFIFIFSTISALPRPQ